MFTQSVIGGLQGPTLSPVITRQGERWYAAHLIVRKDQLSQAITELRQVGGSGVVVTPGDLHLRRRAARIPEYAEPVWRRKMLKIYDLPTARASILKREALNS
jgi:hypothetical protein